MKAARRKFQLTPHQKQLLRAKMRQEKRAEKMWNILSGQEQKTKNPWEGLASQFTINWNFQVKEAEGRWDDLNESSEEKILQEDTEILEGTAK